MDGDEENYGVYFYCNQRLIIGEVKDREVGFISAYAGVPHPDASLARVIVWFDGPAVQMPWNSSKTAINYGHETFKALEKIIFSLVRDFASLSRQYKNDWDARVFKYDEGKMVAVEVPDL